MRILEGMRGPVAAPSVILDPSRFRRKDEALDIKTVAQAVAAQKKSVEAANEKFEAALKKATADVDATKTLSTEMKAELEAVTKSAKDALDRLQENEQELVKMREAFNQRQQAAKSIGAQFVDDAAVKRLLDRETRSASMSFKSITSNTTGTGDAGVMIDPQRIPGVITQPDRPPTIRQLLGGGQTTSNALEYVRETGFTNAATPVAEGTLKPESDLQFELLTAPVRTIAHWFLASTQVLDDVPMLRSYIDQRLRYGLELEEENQLLLGDGTGQNLSGLIPNATPFDTGRAQVGDTRIDIIRRAMTQVRIAEYMADAIVMHPDDWEAIELTKTSEGAYIWANPAVMGAARLWGLPVITTTAMSSGDFLVGNFMMAAAVWDRMAARVDVALQDRDNFVKNMVTIRGEQRLALTIYRPEALITGDFTAIVSG